MLNAFYPFAFSHKGTRLLPVFVAVCLLCTQALFSQANAATRTWTGAGANNNWSTPANWGGTAPVAGDDLVFPAGAARKLNTNDFAIATSFNTLTVADAGYTLSGASFSLASASPINLSTSSSAAGDDITIRPSVTLTAANPSIIMASTAPFTDIDIVGLVISPGPTAALTFQGTLTVNMTSAQKQVRLGARFNESAPGSNIICNASSGDDLDLAWPNNLSGSITANDCFLRVGNDAALGSADGTGATGTILNPGGRLVLVGARNIANEQLSMNMGGNLVVETGSSIYSGPIVLTGTLGIGAQFGGFASGALRINGSISQTGALPASVSFFNSGSVVTTLANPANSWAGKTTIGNNVVLVLAAQDVLPNDTDLFLNGSVNVNLSGFMETVRGIVGSAAFRLDNGTLRVARPPAPTSPIYSGNISGSGNLTKYDAGLIRLAGVNSSTGVYTLEDGNLEITGDSSLVNFVLQSGAFTGNGQIGGLTDSGLGQVSITPGTVAFGTGILRTGAVQLAKPNFFRPTINGTALGSGYTQMDVAGTLNIGINMPLILFGTYVANLGERFVIINNDASDPIIGTFAGLAEAGALTFNGRRLSISYLGGDGNDVVLTRANLPLSLSPTTLPNGALTTVYAQTLSASGGRAPYTYAISAGALPGGLSMSAAGAITGTPTSGGSTSNFSVTVTDADATSLTVPYSITIGVPSLSIGAISVTETDTGTDVNAAFSVRLSQVSPIPVTVDFSTSNGTALAPNDFTERTGTLTIAPNTLEQTLNIVVRGDNLVEATEVFSVVLSNPGNATISTPVGIASILDNDSNASVSIADAVLAEGASGTSNLVFTVSITPIVPVATQIDFSTLDASAVAGSDYTAIVLQTLIIPANTASANISVSVQGDNIVEANETMLVRLSSVRALNYTITRDTGIGTITNDDSTVLSITGVTGPEGNSGLSPLNFALRLSNPVQGVLSVAYSSQDGSATVADNDYQAASGSVSFVSEATTANITVNAIGDLIVEPDQSFSVNLGALVLPAGIASSAFNVAPSTATGTIQNEDAVIQTTLSLTGPASSALNQPASYSFTLAVTAPGAGVPAGLLTVQSGAQNCQITLPSVSTSCAISFSSLGPKTISASFAPSNGNFAASSTAANVNTLVFARTDLRVTKTNGVGSYSPNEFLVYTITVRNAGVDAAPRVRLIDAVPASLLNVAWTCTGSGLVCPAAGGVGSMSELYPMLPVNGQLTYTLSGTVNGSIANIANTALLQLPQDGTVVANTPNNLSATDTDFLDFLFSNGFENQSINAMNGSFNVPSAALRSMLDETAVQVFSLSDSNGEALRIYARELFGAQEFALATRDSAGSWTLGAWQRFAAEPRLSWTATRSGERYLLASAVLR